MSEKPQWWLDWERDIPGRPRKWWQFPCRHNEEDWSLWPGDIHTSGFWPSRYECRKCGRVRHGSAIVHV